MQCIPYAGNTGNNMLAGIIVLITMYRKEKRKVWNYEI